MPARFALLLFFTLAAGLGHATTAYVSTSAQTISVFGPSLGLEKTPILAGPNVGQIAFT